MREPVGPSCHGPCLRTARASPARRLRTALGSRIGHGSVGEGELVRLRVFLVSIAVCVFVGVPAATVLCGVLNNSPSLPFRSDIAGMPVLAYAFIAGSPIAIVGGVLGGGVLLALLESKRWNLTRQGWIVTCSACGFVAATSLALILALSLSIEPVVPWAAMCGLPGGLCGALIGLYGWHVKHGSAATQA